MMLAALIESLGRLRLWCFRCGHEVVLLDTHQLVDDWFLDVAEVAMPCPRCRLADQVMALPARGQRFELLDARRATEDVVATLFHGFRSLAKKRRRDWR